MWYDIVIGKCAAGIGRESTTRADEGKEGKQGKDWKGRRDDSLKRKATGEPMGIFLKKGKPGREPEEY